MASKSSHPSATSTRGVRKVAFSTDTRPRPSSSDTRGSISLGGTISQTPRSSQAPRKSVSQTSRRDPFASGVSSSTARSGQSHNIRPFSGSYAGPGFSSQVSRLFNSSRESIYLNALEEAPNIYNAASLCILALSKHTRYTLSKCFRLPDILTFS